MRKGKATEDVIIKVNVNKNVATLKEIHISQEEFHSKYSGKSKNSVRKINEYSRTKASTSVK